MSSTASLVSVELPPNLCRLTGGPGTVQLAIEGVVTQRAILDALEARYPMLRGTLRDQSTRLRRSFIRFFACGEDFSHLAPDEALPQAIAEGREPLLIVGAIAGG